MDYRSIYKVLGLIGLTLGVFFLSDIAVALYYGEKISSMVIFVVVFFVINFTVWYRLKEHRVNLRIRESILLVNLLWALLGVVGAVPLLIYSDISVSSAIFEAVSGFTTTGATIYTDIESLPKTVLYHRSLTHWIGGMGIVVLGVGLLSIINPTGSMGLFKAEATGIVLEKLTPKIKDTALRLWGVYIVLTLTDTILLKLFGMSWFDAINHAFSTISTGGFSTRNSSIGAFDSDAIIWITTIFMLLSGVNFMAHLKMLYGDPQGYRSEEFRWYIGVFLSLSLLVTMTHDLVDGDSIYHSMMHSSFTIASIMTTTGFASIDYSRWSHVAIASIFIAMFIGANAGSTAGGVKVIRYVVIFKTLFAEFKRILHPNAMISVFIDGKKLKERILASTFGFFTLYIITATAITLYIYASDYDAMTAVSASLAIVGNIGPGFSLVGPAENFAFFSDFDKLFLSIGMIVGRLECYTLFVLFSSSFWKKF
jgi:trk system potassium uptake protein TrkH